MAAKENNLFLRLSRYSPRPGRNPLEDFSTECLAYLLEVDGPFFWEFVTLFCSKAETPRSAPTVSTQFWIPSGGRIDLALFWIEGGRKHSLFVENKTWSIPWTREGNNGEEQNQIEMYREYQESLNVQTGSPDHSVALLSPFPIRGYESPKGAYRGNFLWSQIAGLLGNSRRENIIHNDLIQQFIVFLRRTGMASFVNFQVSELSSLLAYSSYQSKLEALTGLIMQRFEKRLEEMTKEWSLLKVTQAWGVGTVSYHYGALLYDGSVHVSESCFGVLVGMSTSNPPVGGWWPMLTMGETQIPDVQTHVGMFFGSQNELKSFCSKHSLGQTVLSGDRMGEFEILPSGDEGLILIRRRSLLSFLCENEQLDAIVSYLEKGLDVIANSNTEVGRVWRAYLREQEG